jgi:RNA ligase
MFTLQQALEAIKNKPEFSYKEKDGYSVIDYNYMDSNTFTGKDNIETAILQNLRGTCFDKDGKIIRLMYHKFHNLNENPEYHHEKIAKDHGDRYSVEQKLDGSLIAPIKITEANYRLGTRAGVTEYSDMAEQYLKSVDFDVLLDYDNLIMTCLNLNLTPMFEFCSRKNRVVIDHPVDRLVLHGIRCMVTGVYVNIYSFPVPSKAERVEIRSSEESSLTEVAAHIAELENDEGVVLKYPDGFMVKMKSLEYVNLHRCVDGLRTETSVLKLILNNQLDDALAIIKDDLKNKVVAYRDSVLQSIENSEATIRLQYANLVQNGKPVKKDFAKLIFDNEFKSQLFLMYDDKPLEISCTIKNW